MTPRNITAIVGACAAATLSLAACGSSSDGSKAAAPSTVSVPSSSTSQPTPGGASAGGSAPNATSSTATRTVTETAPPAASASAAPSASGDADIPHEEVPPGTQCSDAGDFHVTVTSGSVSCAYAESIGGNPEVMTLASSHGAADAQVTGISPTFGSRTSDCWNVLTGRYGNVACTTPGGGELTYTYAG